MFFQTAQKKVKTNVIAMARSMITKPSTKDSGLQNNMINPNTTNRVNG